LSTLAMFLNLDNKCLTLVPARIGIDDQGGWQEESGAVNASVVIGVSPEFIREVAKVLLPRK